MLAFALGGLVFVVYRAVHVDVMGPFYWPNDAGGTPLWAARTLATATSWDLAVGAAVVVVALGAVAALWLDRPVRR